MGPMEGLPPDLRSYKKNEDMRGAGGLAYRGQKTNIAGIETATTMISSGRPIRQ